MKRLAFFTLEGLLQQGPHQVWVTLGTYPSAESANAAANSRRALRPGILQTRIMPLFRDSGHTLGVDCHRPNLPKSPTHTPASINDSYTVA